MDLFRCCFALMQVFTVVGRDNMWANVHPAEVREPWSIGFSWELEDTRKWAPLYTSIHSRPPELPDAQVPVMYYQPAHNFVTKVLMRACSLVNNAV